MLLLVAKIQPHDTCPTPHLTHSSFPLLLILLPTIYIIIFIFIIIYFVEPTYIHCFFLVPAFYVGFSTWHRQGTDDGEQQQQHAYVCC